MRRGGIGVAVDMVLDRDDEEIEVRVEGTYYTGERDTRSTPGMPAWAEVDGVEGEGGSVTLTDSEEAQAMELLVAEGEKAVRDHFVEPDYDENRRRV